jgi:hypothetical protein
MAPRDPMLEERRRLGPIELLSIEASSLPEAHRRLGATLAAPASAAIAAQIAATPRPALAQQLATAAASAAFLHARAASREVAAPIRRALTEYLECLAAWAEAAGVDALLGDALAVDGRRVTREELALWAQDDNTGCQTGLLRRADGSVILWHTEEDTIGHLDRPRLVSFAVGGETLSAFLYPYLLPGPAFGFRTGQVHAVDSLHVRRDRTPSGAFTSTVSWLVWRLGPAVDAAAVARALSPCVDGCALVIAQPTSRGVQAAVHELGGRHLASRRLPDRAGARDVQVNMVHRVKGRLGREEALTRRERLKYERRVARARDFLHGAGRDPGPGDLLRMLAGRRGGTYAFANADVKAHCVAVIGREGFELHAEAGPACRGDAYRPAWRLP